VCFFKACLFLGSGSVIHALHGEQDMRNMGGLKKVMPITFWTMMISTLAISGIFPFAGFWSKDEILMAAFHGNVVLWVVGSIASIMTAFYMFRLMYLTFFGTFRGTEEQKHHLHESPALITIPLVILAILAAVGGAINLPGSAWLNHFIAPLFHKSHGEHHLDNTAFMLMGIATVGALVGIFIAYAKYIKKQEVPGQDSEIKGIAKVMYNKFYVDEAYEALIVNPIYKLSHFFRKYTEVMIAELLFGLGKVTNVIGNQGKLIQNGSIGVYLLAFVIGLSSILVYIFLV
jgi:NADH-quinone oxidoreductase subunit L